MNIHLLLRIGLAALIAFTLMSAVGQRTRTSAPLTVPYSELLAAVSVDDVSRDAMAGERVVGQRRGGELFTTLVPNDPGLIGDLLDAGVTVSAQAEPEPSLFGRALLTLLPLLLLVGVWIYFMRRQRGAGGAGGTLGFGRSRARARDGDDVDVRRADVAGIDEVKEEVGEGVDFLRDPPRIRSLGGTVPRGVLLVGPPGRGLRERVRRPALPSLRYTPDHLKHMTVTLTDAADGSAVGMPVVGDGNRDTFPKSMRMAMNDMLVAHTPGTAS